MSSQRIISMGDFDDRKLKRKIEELPTKDDADSDLLSLRLGSSSSNNKKSKSFKGSDSEDSGSPPKPVEVEPSNDEELDPNERDQFSCKFCDKMFSNSQALGGHQNAHRRERVLSKMDKELEMDTFGLGPHPLCPYSAMVNLPFGGTPLYHGDARIHPMAHMPYMSWPLLGPASYASRLGYNSNVPNYTSLAMRRFGMTSSWSVGTETPKRLNDYDDIVGFGAELDQIPSLAESAAANRGSSGLARARFGGGLQGNLYKENQQCCSSEPDLSLSL